MLSKCLLKPSVYEIHSLSLYNRTISYISMFQCFNVILASMKALFFHIILTWRESATSCILLNTQYIPNSALDAKYHSRCFTWDRQAWFSTEWRLKSPASRLFTQPFIRAQIKENIKAPRHRPLLGNSQVTGEFPSQKASNAENVSIGWRHHVSCGPWCSLSRKTYFLNIHFCFLWI